MGATDQLLLIRNYNLWSDLSDEEYEELNLIHHFKEAKRNEYLYFESHHHNKIYFLKDGFIRIGYIDEHGREVVKEIIRKGEVFGQITLEPYNLNGEFAQAYKGDVSLCAFNIDDFEKLLNRKPRIALRYGKLVGQQMRRVESRLISLLHKDVKTRLAGFFLLILDKENLQGNTASIPNFLRHEDIAQLIGASRQTVSTTISELETAGLVTFSRSLIFLSDVNALQKLASVS
jgi:CRP/FNR family transcriptional regulator